METYCIFSAQYLPSVGGVEQYTENLANVLIRRGNRVIIVTTEKKGVSQFEKKANGAIVYRVPTLQLINGRMPVTYFSSDWMRLKKKLKAENITRVIIQTRLYTLSIMGMRFAKKNGISCMTIEHGTSWVGMSNRVMQIFEIAYEKCLLQIAKRYCTAFCSVSKEGEKWLKYLKIDCSGVLYNSVDEQIIYKYLKNFRKENKNGKKETRIVFVGRLIKEKGLYQLVQAIQELNEEGVRIELVIVGDGPLYKEFLDRKISCVLLKGRLVQKDVMRELYYSDIFCLPSDSEGFPTSVLEAILCKTYVITAPYGGAKEIISSRRYGTVMKDNTCSSIKESIKNVIELGKKKQIVEENIYNRFLNEFTWEKTCNALEALHWEEMK